MGMFQNLSKSLGIDQKKLMSILPQVTQMLSGVNQNDDTQVQRFLKEQGISKSGIDKLIENPKVQKIIGTAKVAKSFGIKPMGLDVDEVINKSKAVFSVREQTNTNYPSYDRRNSDVYARASSLPD